MIYEYAIEPELVVHWVKTEQITVIFMNSSGLVHRE